MEPPKYGVTPRSSWPPHHLRKAAADVGDGADGGDARPGPPGRRHQAFPRCGNDGGVRAKICPPLMVENNGVVQLKDDDR